MPNPPANRSRLSLQWRIVLYVFPICAALIGLDVWHSWNAYTNQTRQLQQATGSAAEIAAQQLQDTLQVADMILQSLLDNASGPDMSAALAEKAAKTMRIENAAVPQVDNLAIFDEKGNLVTQSNRLPIPAINVGDRDYFVHHRDHPDQSIRINPPLVSRISHRWILPMTMRINNPDGSFAGVAGINVNSDFLAAFYKRMNLGQHGAVNIFLGDGMLLLRWPFRTEIFGKDFTRSKLFQATLKESNHGSKTLTSSLDGVARHFSFRRLDCYPVFVMVGMSVDEAYAPWWRDTLAHAAVCLLIAVLISWGSIRLIQQIELRGKAENELSRANQTLEKMAMHDDLTGIANRRYFDIALPEKFGQARRHGHSLAIVMLDIDCFKQYNDRYGHVAGDECLKRVARAISAVAAKRPGDMLARYGGEEFVVVLPETDLNGAIVIAERMRAAVQDLGMKHADSPTGVVTISAGVNAYQPVREYDEANALLMSADEALYQAKKFGRNRVFSITRPAENPAPAH
jgi:diguanylate cyclase (GGDEF)-like protein